MAQSSPSAWERLCAVATLGTRKAPLPKEGLWPDASLAAAAGSNGELTLLRAAAATHLFDLAGKRAASNPNSAAIDAPAALARTQVAEIAAWRLARMIGGEHRELIAEWLGIARQARKSLPPHWVPVVLEGIAPDARRGSAEVLGPVAPWLSAQNANWQVDARNIEPNEERWQLGSAEERRALLAALRATDSARALDWLQSTWQADPPELREAFLQIVQRIGLGPHDEKFLEAALDDKRKGVRLAAAECLARLPDSAHAQRLRTRLEPLLVLDAQSSGLLGRFRKRKLLIELPATLDKALARDGVEAKPPAQRKIGERAFWLTQMVSMVPPAHWCARFECEPATLVEAVLGSDYAQDLLGALSDAAVRHPDSAWIEVLCNAWMDHVADRALVAQSIAALLAAAPTGDRARLLEAQLRRHGDRDFNLVLRLLDSHEHWSEPTTAFALVLLRQQLRGDAQQWSYPRNILDGWARQCAPDAAARGLPDVLGACNERSPWRNALEQMSEIVEFRISMRRELLT